MGQVVCAACGNAFPVEDRFCGRCGRAAFGLRDDLDATLPPEAGRLAAGKLFPEPEPPDPPLRPGAIFARRYRIQRRLGQGGMGSVFAALDQSIEDVVALKVLSRKYSGDAAMLDQFKRELKLARKVRQRNVVQSFDLGFAEDLCYISMEYIDAENLSIFLDRCGPLPEPEALRIMQQVLRGLKAAHDLGIIHRDIKSGNILVNSDRMAFITDFGLATPSALVPRLLGGTPVYMAPEQFLGNAVVEATDLYACGILLQVLLTGRPPFYGIDFEVLKEAHLNARPEPLPESHGGAATRELIADLLRKDPAARPQKAAEVLERVNGILAFEIATVRTQRPIALLVEGDPSVQSLGAKALEDSGYHVLTANAARQGVRLAFENDLSVIVLDSGIQGGYELALEADPTMGPPDPNTPGLDGLGFCRILRADQKLRFVPILVTGEREQPGLREAFGQLGVVSVLTRPFEAKELSRAVRSAQTVGAGQEDP